MTRFQSIFFFLKFSHMLSVCLSRSDIYGCPFSVDRLRYIFILCKHLSKTCYCLKTIMQASQMLQRHIPKFLLLFITLKILHQHLSLHLHSRLHAQWRMTLLHLNDAMQFAKMDMQGWKLKKISQKQKHSNKSKDSTWKHTPLFFFHIHN